MAEWIVKNHAENPLYEKFDRLLDICHEYDVTLSLGDGLRPGTIFDAEDGAQITEMITLGHLADQARKAGIQVMIEGPGHVPLSRIAGDMKTQKRVCGGRAPIMCWGPCPRILRPGTITLPVPSGVPLPRPMARIFFAMSPRRNICPCPPWKTCGKG